MHLGCIPTGRADAPMCRAILIPRRAKRGPEKHYLEFKKHYFASRREYGLFKFQVMLFLSPGRNGCGEDTRGYYARKSVLSLGMLSAQGFRVFSLRSGFTLLIPPFFPCYGTPSGVRLSLTPLSRGVASLRSAYHGLT